MGFALRLLQNQAGAVWNARMYVGMAAKPSQGPLQMHACEQDGLPGEFHLMLLCTVYAGSCLVGNIFEATVLCLQHGSPAFD